MRRILKLVAAVLALGAGGWSSAFAFYAVPGGSGVATGAAAAVAAVTLAAVGAIAIGRPLGAAPLAVAVAAALVGFLATQPSNERDWAPDVAHPVTATVDGSVVRLDNVRNFDWRSETDVTQRWEARTYDLADARTLDVVNSYWTGPAIAHTLLSFGFADGRYLAFSIEIRRERTEEYSAFAGFFRRYERITVAADERDIVRLRSNIRREDPELYRVRAEPAQVQALLREMLSRADRLAAQPAFYNTLTANCTTELFGAARAVAPGLPFDWRIILSGYLPDYLYDQGLLDTRVPFPDLKRAAAFKAGAIAAGDAPDFSSAIRAGLPDPNR